VIWQLWPERREPGGPPPKVVWEGLPGVEPPGARVGDDWWDGRVKRTLTEDGWVEVDAPQP